MHLKVNFEQGIAMKKMKKYRQNSKQAYLGSAAPSTGAFCNAALASRCC